MPDVSIPASVVAGSAGAIGAVGAAGAAGAALDEVGTAITVDSGGDV